MDVDFEEERKTIRKLSISFSEEEMEKFLIEKISADNPLEDGFTRSVIAYPPDRPGGRSSVIITDERNDEGYAKSN